MAIVNGCHLKSLQILPLILIGITLLRLNHRSVHYVLCYNNQCCTEENLFCTFQRAGFCSYGTDRDSGEHQVKKTICSITWDGASGIVPTLPEQASTQIQSHLLCQYKQFKIPKITLGDLCIVVYTNFKVTGESNNTHISLCHNFCDAYPSALL